MRPLTAKAPPCRPYVQPVRRGWGRGIVGMNEPLASMRARRRGWPAAGLVRGANTGPHRIGSSESLQEELDSVSVVAPIVGVVVLVAAILGCVAGLFYVLGAGWR